MKTFKRIYIEITNCCNLQCSFCPPSKRHQAFMSLEAFEEVLQKIKGHGQYVYLHIKGEPMLHPNFIEILELCHIYGLKVNLTTNGTLIEDQMEQLLKAKALRQISISLQSQENLEDTKAFDHYINTILRMINKGIETSDIIFELRLWNYQNTFDGEHGNSHALGLIRDQLGISQDIIDAIPQGKGTKLMSNVYLSKSLEFQWPDIGLKVINDVGTCYGLRQQVGILVNGDVVPCCLDGDGVVNLGNIFMTTFENIVTSDRAQAIVSGFECGNIVEPLCQRCGYRKRFS